VDAAHRHERPPVDDRRVVGVEPRGTARLANRVDDVAWVERDARARFVRPSYFPEHGCGSVALEPEDR
jgi:hypothetical protein